MLSLFREATSEVQKDGDTILGYNPLACFGKYVKSTAKKIPVLAKLKQETELEPTQQPEEEEDEESKAERLAKESKLKATLERLEKSEKTIAKKQQADFVQLNI
jgi:hypothetical protein